jgi:hypothetical protein
MDPIQESRERQRLYVPNRSAVRPAGPPPAGGPPGEPWASDYPWRPEGQTPDYTPEIRYAVPARVAALVVIGALNLLLPSAAPPLKTGILLLDAVGLILLFDSLNKLWYGLRGRLPRLKWKTFPAFTGGRLEAVLVARPSPEIVGPVLAELRCVLDERVVRETEQGEEVSHEPVMIYRQISEFPVPGERLRELSMSFEIPPDLPGTDLGREDAVYWQIALRIPVVGPDLETVYLAPIYARRS